MMKLLIKALMLLMTRKIDKKTDKRKIKLFFWSFISAIVYGALCYTFFFFINTYANASASFAIVTYVFIAGEILLAFVVMNRYEQLDHDTHNNPILIQETLHYITKKENILSFTTISVLAIASFMLFKSKSKVL